MPGIKKKTAARIDAFHIKPGRVIGDKYRVERKLGGGWEGEVYRVVERKTGIQRAGKLFYPQRNKNDRAVTFYAQKLERLRECPIVIQYIHSERVVYRNEPITCLISELVEGELLERFVRRAPGGRLKTFEAMHLLHTLAVGLEQIHKRGEYHGDLHAGNVLVRRRGIFFDLKLVDFYHWGPPSKATLKEDVADLIRLFYDAVGGPRHYRNQPDSVKSVCRGLRRDLIDRAFPTVTRLREHLESFDW